MPIDPSSLGRDGRAYTLPRRSDAAASERRVVAKSQILHEQLAAGAEGSNDQYENKPQQAQH
jgi:hypothetical protein